MEFDHAFSVAAPIDAVWATIADVERAAPCLPNTRVTGRAGPDSVNVEVTAAVGPIELTAAGTITLVERDDAARRAVLKVVANDPDGDMLADATVAIVLSEDGDATTGAVHSSVEVGGLATLVGEQTIDQAAASALRTFAKNVEALLARSPS